MLVDIGTWVGADTGYQRAQLNLLAAERAADNPPGAVAAMEQESAELRAESARLALQRAREAAERDYRATVRGLETAWLSLRVSRERLDLERRRAEVAELRFERGLITRSERDRQLVAPLSAEVRYLDALKSAVNAVITYRSRLDLPLDPL